MAKWIRSELGEETPLHFSRFQPMYKLRNLPPTTTASLEHARAETMDAGLQCVSRPPSGRGYDYDRGWTMARGDVGVDRYLYYAGRLDARRLASLSRQVEANCGFTIKYG